MAISYNNIMGTKTDYLYVRLTKAQKLILKRQAAVKQMSQSEYVWFLVTNDYEKEKKNETKD